MSESEETTSKIKMFFYNTYVQLTIAFIAISLVIYLFYIYFLKRSPRKDVSQPASQPTFKPASKPTSEPTSKPTINPYGKWLSSDGYTLLINNNNTLLYSKIPFEDQDGKYDPSTGEYCLNNFQVLNCKITSSNVFKIIDINNAVTIETDFLGNSKVTTFKRIIN